MSILGRYLIFLRSLFRNREKFNVYVGLVIDECIQIGINSVFIIAIVSTFIGGVSCVQTAYQLVSPLIPTTIISQIVRDTTLLEFAPTITSIVLSGKVGSSIASGLGTMRITEQIDALEVMGINSASYLVLPKVIAAIIMVPLLVILSAFLSICGGYVAGMATGIVSSEDFITGLQSNFQPFNISFALIKAVVFAFLISTISSFKGFYTSGGALEVGQSSTAAVTNSCIAVLAADFILAQLLLQ